MKWKRKPEQEGGLVLRWFEKGNQIVSVVQSKDFSDEVEFRFHSFIVRSDKSIFDEKTDEEIISKIKYHLEV